LSAEMRAAILASSVKYSRMLATPQPVSIAVTSTTLR
jgi:hypothetical protein